MSSTIDRINSTTKSKKAPGKEEEEPFWGEDRRVIIRPDVPGRDTHPEDSILIRSDKERAVVRNVLDRMYQEVRQELEQRVLRASQAEAKGEE